MLKVKTIFAVVVLNIIFMGIFTQKIAAQPNQYIEDNNQTPNLVQVEPNKQLTEEERSTFIQIIKLLFGIPDSNQVQPSSLQQSVQKIPTAQTASFVDSLISQIKNACVYNGQPGAVNRNNVLCLDNVNISTRDVLKESATTHENLQCVGFVRAVVIATTGLDVCEAAGSANECKDNNTYYEFVYTNSGRQIQPGDLPIWSFLKYGHIAYVTKVNGSKYFDVAEANFTNGGKLYNGSVQIRHATTDEPEFAGWLTKKI